MKYLHNSFIFIP